jgi:hypothetical protein
MLHGGLSAVRVSVQAFSASMLVVSQGCQPRPAALRSFVPQITCQITGVLSGAEIGCYVLRGVAVVARGLPSLNGLLFLCIAFSYIITLLA